MDFIVCENLWFRWIKILNEKVNKKVEQKKSFEKASR